MKRSWKVPVIAGITMIVFNVILFVIPFRKTATVWISDVAVILALAAQIPISDMVFKKKNNTKNRVYGWPTIRVGIRYLVAIMISAIALIVLSGNIQKFPVWIAIVTYALLYTAAVVGLITSASIGNYIEQQDVKMEEETHFMRKLYAEMEALEKSISNKEISEIIKNLTEKIRFSDPVSCTEIFEQEGMIYATFGDLRESVKKENTDEIKSISHKFEEQLETRNSMCKFAKREN